MTDSSGSVPHLNLTESQNQPTIDPHRHMRRSALAQAGLGCNDCSHNNKKNGENNINLIMQIGFALCLASSVLFHFRLFQLNSHLRENYPDMWKMFGSGNEELSRAAQYYSITKLSTEYRVNDSQLDVRFTTLRRLHQSGAIGACILIAGLVFEWFGS